MKSEYTDPQDHADRREYRKSRDVEQYYQGDPERLFILKETAAENEVDVRRRKAMMKRWFDCVMSQLTESQARLCEARMELGPEYDMETLATMLGYNNLDEYLDDWQTITRTARQCAYEMADFLK
jgi:hypothetical protein